ncbi:MAG: hypothetical protein AAF253_05135 [Pseudomonadota bacterium]
MSIGDFHPEGRAATHWSFWVIAVLAVLWNGFGSFDFLMTQIQGQEYLRQMLTEEQIQDYLTMPVWAEGAWGLAIASSILASILLLLRRTWAVPLFALSLVSMLVSFFYQLVMMGELARSGIAAAIFPAVIVAIGVFLLSYAMRQDKAGVLR